MYTVATCVSAVVSGVCSRLLLFSQALILVSLSGPIP